jgi:hypothetical protein
MKSRKIISEVRAVRELVDFVENRQSFVDFSTNKTLRGVSKACKKHYYPDFKLSSRVTKKSCDKRPKSDPCRYSHIVGSLRGSIVDQEIQRVTLRGEDGIHKMHPYTRKLVRALKVAGLQPLVCQVPVFDLDRGLATAVDLVCESHDRQTLYLVEIKCGFNGNTYTDHNAQMKHELKNVSNCPKHQHQVQASVTHALFEKCYASQKRYRDVKTLIARVTDEGTYFEPIRQWVVPHVPCILERI